MKKVAIVGVEGSGKTVMLAGLGDLYTNPDAGGYFLSPKNYGTASYVANKIARMRAGEWPSATAGDAMQGLDWTLKQATGARSRPKDICEVSFLDFAGEVYRHAFGIKSGSGDHELADQVASLRSYIEESDELIVLINLRDVIVRGMGDERVQEAMWITNAILNFALEEREGRKVPRAAIVLSQADSYRDTIETSGGAVGVLRRYLPHVANNYGWLDVFDASAVDKTVVDADGNVVPDAAFSSAGLSPIMDWILEWRSVGQADAFGTDVGEPQESVEGQQSPSRLYELGRRYEDGAGVPKNVTLALQYYRKASRAGHGEAKFRLGQMYEQGICVARDPSKALKLYVDAASCGCKKAKAALAGMKDRKEARQVETDVKEEELSDRAKAIVITTIFVFVLLAFAKGCCL